MVSKDPTASAAPHVLPALPYADNALAPVISANTISFHYGKHHKTYVDNLNKLVPGTEFEGEPLEAVIRGSAGTPDKQGIFNNAAQVWNHTFYWKCLRGNGGGQPRGPLADKINAAFGGYDNFKKEFANAAVTQFGSGWAWLVADRQGKLGIRAYPNQDSPYMDELTPIMGVDVWEHAYYLKYQNRRADYITAWFNTLNWDAINSRFGSIWS